MSCSAKVALEASPKPQNSIDCKKYGKVSKKIKKQPKNGKRKHLLASSYGSSQKTNSRTTRRRNPKSHSQNLKQTPTKLNSIEIGPFVENEEEIELKEACYKSQLSINTNYLDKNLESNLKNEVFFNFFHVGIVCFRLFCVRKTSWKNIRFQET